MALRNLKSIGTFSRNIFQWNLMKTTHVNLSATQLRGIKQIVKTEEEGGNVVIEGVFQSSARLSQLVKVDATDHPKSCYMCKLNLDLKHTVTHRFLRLFYVYVQYRFLFQDVLILNQFLRSDGCMLPQRITGLCKRQQKRVSTLVTMAQKAGLMSSINPPGSKKNPRLRYKWKQWNSYWDETTIKC